MQLFRLSALCLAAALPLLAQNKPEDFPKQPDVPALSPEEQLKKFQLPPGYRLELVLAEPHIKEPVVAVVEIGRAHV